MSLTGSQQTRKAEADAECFGTCADLPQGPVLVTAGLGAQLGPSCIQPSPAEAAITVDQAPAASDTGLHHSPSQNDQKQHMKRPAQAALEQIQQTPQTTD